MLKLISAFYLVLLILLSLIPLSGIEAPGNSDKVIHFIAYAVLGILAYFTGGTFKNRIYLFIAVIALGVVLEALQAIIPGRNFSSFDIFANAAGVLFGFGISWMFRASKETPRYGGCGSPHATVPVKHIDEEKG